MEKKLGKKAWLSIIIFSLVGQIAWTMENMFYNLYIVEQFNASTNQIALMVSLSALTATLTTLFMGALSDKIGKRKIFIVSGYFLWGITILSFIFVNNKYISSSILGVALVILLDCLMTFFGSTANDAAYNAYLTETTDETNRGKVEGVNSAMPLIAILIVFGGLSSFAKGETWSIVYLIIGVIVLLSGVLGIFTIKEPKNIERKNESYFKNIFYGFKPSVIKENKILYIILIAFAIFGISLQVFMPFYIIYLQNAGLEIEFAAALGFDSYVIIMAPAIIIAAVFTIIYGRLIDKLSFIKSLIPTITIYIIGLLLLTIFKTEIMMFVGCMLMMCGYLGATASFNTVIRKYTPQDKVGLFQGLRIVAQVLIPMLIGPWIGSVICGGGAIFGVAEEGFNVSPYIFLGAIIVVLFIIIPILFIKEKKNYNKLYTDEYKDLDKLNPLPEYPNPNFQRDSYISLNGIWKYKISKDINNLKAINNDILVPFPIESAASLAEINLKHNEYIIYKKNFNVPASFINDKVYIHLLGIDQEYNLIINDKKFERIVTLNLPTKIDITNYIKEDNELIIIVKDNLNSKYPLGKQSKHPKGIFYTPFSGIYYPIYLEAVSNDCINGLSIDTTLDTLKLKIDTDSDYIKISILDNNNVIYETESKSKAYEIKIENPILWDIANPHLYDLVIETKNDKVKTYFGLREIKIIDGFVYLNNKKLFINGILDQGYYPEGISTPVSYKTIEKDILTMKELGFNTLRKHLKIEIPYFYYLCDKLGMLVLQDFVNNGKYNFITQTAIPTLGLQKKKDKNMNKNQIQRDNFIKCGEQLITYLNNHPSIIGYTIFNEGWGQFDSENVYNHFKNLYPNLIFDTASGWFRGAKTDMDSYHWYFKNIDKLKDVKKPVFISEFGALCYKYNNHVYGNDHVFGYKYFDTIEELEDAFVALYEEKIIPYKDKLIGVIYTQITDVEEEDNGLLTYDRQILKIDKLKIQDVLSKLNQ